MHNGLHLLTVDLGDHTYIKQDCVGQHLIATTPLPILLTGLTRLPKGTDFFESESLGFRKLAPSKPNAGQADRGEY